MEHSAVFQAQVLGGTDVKSALEVQGGIGTEHQPTRVHQIQIRTWDLRTETPVDQGNTPAGNPPQNVLHTVRAREGGTLTRVDRKVTEAVEEVDPAQLA